MNPTDYKKALDSERSTHTQLMRDQVMRLVSLCEAAGVDPATLEDGIEMLHAGIANLRAENGKLRKQLAAERQRSICFCQGEK